MLCVGGPAPAGSGGGKATATTTNANSNASAAAAVTYQIQEDSKLAQLTHDETVASKLDPWAQAADEWDSVMKVRNAEADQKLAQQLAKEEASKRTGQTQVRIDPPRPAPTTHPSTTDD